MPSSSLTTRPQLNTGNNHKTRTAPTAAAAAAGSAAVVLHGQCSHELNLVTSSQGTDAGASCSSYSGSGSTSSVTAVRCQPTLPARGHHLDTAALRQLDYARLLTARINQTRHWTGLELVWHQYYGDFNHIHMTAAATHLTKLVQASGLQPCDRPELFKFSSSIFSSIQSRLHDVDARGVVNCLWAYAALQKVAPHSSISADAAAADLADAALHHLHELRPGEASALIWAVAVLQIQPSSSWLLAYEQHTLPLLASMKPQELGNTIWGCVKLGYRPSDTWVGSFLSYSGLCMDRMGRQELTNILWSLSRLDVRPAEAWLTACYARMQRLIKQQSLQPIDIATLSLSLGKLQITPPEHLMDLLLGQALGMMPQCSPQAMANMLYGLGCLQYKPGSVWLEACLAHTQASMSGFSSGGLATTIWAIAKMGVQPDGLWLDSFAKHVQCCMHRCSPQDLAMLSLAFGRLGYRPCEQWIQAFLVASQTCMHHFNAQELSNLACGLRQLSVKTPKDWQLAFQQATASALTAATPAACTGFLVGMSGLNMQPSDAWFNALEVAVCQTLATWQPHQIAKLLWAFAKLGRVPSILPELLQACLNKSTSMKVIDVANILWALAKLRVTVDQDLVIEMLMQTNGSLHKASQQDVVNILWALAKLQVKPSSAWLDGFWSAASSHMRRLSPRSMVTVLWSLAELHIMPSKGWGWLGSVSQCTLARLDAYTCGQVCSLLCSMVRLHAWPGRSWVDSVSSHVSQQLPDLTDTQLVAVVAALANLGQPSDGHWLECINRELQGRTLTDDQRQVTVDALCRSDSSILASISP
eukprot:jgi/Chrzof1/13301/Cz07g28050.t1